MLKIATWNINSVRLRIAQVCRFLAEAKPDVLCLQEIKCRDGEFPAKAFKEAGYKHMHVVGQKGWHGVAIVSSVKLEPLEAPTLCPKKEARIAAAKIDGIEVHNLYVPAGADVPDPISNPKFEHKLDVLDRMKPLYKKRKGQAPTVLVGDLNVAPGEIRRVEPQAIAQRRQPHAGRNRAARTRCCDLGGFVDLARAAPARAGKALHLVELSQPRLDQEQSRPPARPHLGQRGSRGGLTSRGVSNPRARAAPGSGRATMCRWWRR